jgi:Amt family ammonium transporter
MIGVASVMVWLALQAAPSQAAPSMTKPEAMPTPAAAPTPDKGDTAWMLVSTILVLLMIVPGLALFYGGLVRSKNMLSVMMQVSTVALISFVTWVLWGYSLAFSDGGSWDSFLLDGPTMSEIFPVERAPQEKAERIAF